MCSLMYAMLMMCKPLRKFPMSMTFALSKSIHRFGVKTNGGGGALISFSYSEIRFLN